MRFWMIRHQDLNFTRPIPEAELIEKIESGEVTAQDEISPSGGYWFTIQDIEEVTKHLGSQIRLQALMPTDANSTATNTALTERQRTDKSIGKTPKSQASPQPTPKARPEPQAQTPVQVQTPVQAQQPTQLPPQPQPVRHAPKSVEQQAQESRLKATVMEAQNAQATPPPVEDAPRTQQKLIYGAIFTAIFLGTLVLLWKGSL